MIVSYLADSTSGAALVGRIVGALTREGWAPSLGRLSRRARPPIGR